MVNWLTYDILSSSSFSRCFVPSPLITLFLVINADITESHEVISSHSISPKQWSRVNIDYSLYQLPYTLCTASSQNWLSPAPSQCLTNRQTMLNSILYIPTITSYLMKIVSTPFAPPSQSTASRSTTTKYTSHPAQWWPTSPSPNSLNHDLRCISKVARSLPPSVSPNSDDHALQLHSQTCMITSWECISKFTPS